MHETILTIYFTANQGPLQPLQGLAQVICFEVCRFQSCFSREEQTLQCCRFMQRQGCKVIARNLFSLSLLVTSFVIHLLMYESSQGYLYYKIIASYNPTYLLMPFPTHFPRHRFTIKQASSRLCWFAATVSVLYGEPKNPSLGLATCNATVKEQIFKVTSTAQGGGPVLIDMMIVAVPAGYPTSLFSVGLDGTALTFTSLNSSSRFTLILQGIGE